VPEGTRARHQPQSFVAVPVQDRQRCRRLDGEDGALEVQAVTQRLRSTHALLGRTVQFTLGRQRFEPAADLQAGRERCEIDELVLQRGTRRRSRHERRRSGGERDEERRQSHRNERAAVVDERKRRLPVVRREQCVRKPRLWDRAGTAGARRARPRACLRIAASSAARLPAGARRAQWRTSLRSS
jgi:hypothetical protein